jgi:hypothetical protein
MGILFASSTWRAPLQLIDSWLPAPFQSRPQRRASTPLLQKFARAGWLGKTPQPAVRSAVAPAKQTMIDCPSTTRTATMRIVRASKQARGHTQLVISGRMSDVCAELDRLAAMEPPASAL